MEANEGHRERERGRSRAAGRVKLNNEKEDIANRKWTEWTMSLAAKVHTEAERRLAVDFLCRENNEAMKDFIRNPLDARM